MNKSLQRQIAIDAAKAYYRHLGIDPFTVSELALYSVLLQISRRESESIAARWFNEASDNQWQLLQREWRIWKHNEQVRREMEGGRV